MKIGILTMHKVVNYGSALQAYALQHFLKDNGFECEIIDYVFTNSPHGLKNWLRYLLKRNFISDMKFRHFWKENFILSKRCFKEKEELSDFSCKYDVYLTGSDQVWNPNHNGDELTFMFNFIKSSTARKVSYASSFSTGVIPLHMEEKYRELLSRYSTISVREENALSLIKKLIGKDATWVCDPTLLIGEKTWKELAKKSRLMIKGPYVLFYILTYAYNPYPEVECIIQQVQKRYKGSKFVFLNGKVADKRRRDSVVINNVSPYEFISLIENAEFIVTTSFHGTAFAINFRKPFYSVIQSDLLLDNRMFSLLHRLGLDDRAICYDKKIEFENMEYNSEIENSISDFIQTSQTTLLKSLRS
ncbi:polysaccharide pyruvyl transferase family protein [Bacteroides ovatus]|uniref:polysaccharide pyruvyl transferase family protein n=1 Tax=Bacteroides ovatus TaxID=28116 RepID=UPI00232E5354|nr:polysaccharide pyruvyl transferase family protein [Bacteroides ovatus]MDC2771563.1 polysaccharide pyruvyl transferase family protein [Bacteroides ovatus]MDC2781684.1 polysaccharide pyruvyl transferase family protein [Bacteroides ovatus]MDC2786330.1 polysaccharide pyruvyl transferase family protein [Bacteroides ovatus]MDC2791481.1 polysaccharide pyruvyl transferase family protein [Bacteroides ovatus]MDC2795930.1 polysaccharide pyruvyl transferase family protein [Bacteroides ovatus]